MEKKEIFTITTLQEDPMIQGRCVGFYFDLAKAVDAVQENYFDINEQGYYPYCVIEAVQDGIYSIDRSEHWFNWNIDRNRYEKINKKPDKFIRRCCFGIG